MGAINELAKVYTEYMEIEPSQQEMEGLINFGEHPKPCVYPWFEQIPDNDDVPTMD